MTRILVVDDDKKIVRLVRAYLEQDGFEVLTAHDGETAWHIIRRDAPDLVVLDLMLPDLDGWEITRRVRQDSTLAHLPIIMLTARVEDTDRIVGLELGADDYVSKPFNPREVVARVRAVLRRVGGNGELDAAPRLTLGNLTLDVNRHEAHHQQRPLDLTPTEFNLLRLLLENPQRAFSRRALIEQALGYQAEGTEQTINSHIKNLRRKIGVAEHDPAYIETVRGIGYRLRGGA